MLPLPVRALAPRSPATQTPRVVLTALVVLLVAVVLVRTALRMRRTGDGAAGRLGLVRAHEAAQWTQARSAHMTRDPGSGSF